MSATQSIKQAYRTLEKAKDAVEKAERDITALAALRTKQKPFVVWAKLRDDGTLNSQTLRLSREGAEGSAKWDHKTGRVVRLLCFIDEAPENGDKT